MSKSYKCPDSLEMLALEKTSMLKEERKRLREEKTKKRTNIGEETEKKIKQRKGKCNTNMCFVCGQLYHKADVYDWVGCECDDCDRWQHQRCVPTFHQGALQSVLADDLPFNCHICFFASEV